MTDEAARAKAVWSLGDYPVIAQRLRPAAEALVDAVGVQAGDRLLDVAAGNGNVAIAAAARGSEAVASDISPRMIELGRSRPEASGIEWVEADAQALPFEDGSFDHTLSAFGVIFAPDPALATAEMLRVTRAGGRVGLTAWKDGGINSAAQEAMSAFLPPARAKGKDAWGRAEEVEGRLAGAGAVDVSVTERTLQWEFESLDAWISFMADGAPPVVAARRAIGEERWPEVIAALREAIRPHGRQEGSTFRVEPAYLVATARRPG